jgi:Ras of Complex, Roc, domain of DAPkinase
MIQPIIGIKNLKELDLRGEIFINYFSFSNLITDNNFSIKSSHIIINASSQSNLEKLFISPIPEEYGTNNPLDMNFVRQYLNELKKGKTLSKQMKLLILGKERHGKTSLIHFLREGKSIKSPQSTDGIDINSWKIKGKNNESINLSTWDFAGQQVF